MELVYVSTYTNSFFGSMKVDKRVPPDKGCEYSTKCIKCPMSKCKFDILTESKRGYKKKKINLKE